MANSGPNMLVSLESTVKVEQVQLQEQDQGLQLKLFDSVPSCCLEPSEVEGGSLGELSRAEMRLRDSTSQAWRAWLEDAKTFRKKM